MLAIDDIFHRVGLERALFAEGELAVRTPITGETLAHVGDTRAWLLRGESGEPTDCGGQGLVDAS